MARIGLISRNEKVEPLTEAQVEEMFKILLDSLADEYKSEGHDEGGIMEVKQYAFAKIGPVTRRVNERRQTAVNNR